MEIIQNKDSMMMQVVFYKFKCAKDYVSLPIDWHYTTASDVLNYVLEKKCSGKPKDYDNLYLTNAHTHQHYLDGNTLIPKGTFLVIRRAPRVSYMPILVNPPPEQSNCKEEEEEEDVCATEDGSCFDVLTHDEWVELWKDLSPSTVIIPPTKAALPGKPKAKADEDRKIKDLIDTPALDSRQTQNFTDSFGGVRGFGRGGLGGRSGGRGFGQRGLLNQITPPPPPGYICHRCKVPGHFIHHCPTNGDPSFDAKRIKPGVVAELKPNEAASKKSIQPSTRSVAKLPPEFYCPLCRTIMKDAVLVGKCCFNSFCDKCIRDYIMSKSLCFCGALNVLADDLLPNKTLRSTIVRLLESPNSGASGGSCAPCAQPKIPCSQVPSPTLSAPSKGVVIAPKTEGNTKTEEMIKTVEADDVAHETLGKLIVGNGVEVSKSDPECSHRDLSEIGTGSNGGDGPPVIRTGEFDALKNSTEQKQDHETNRGSMKLSRDRDFDQSMIIDKEATFVKSDFKRSPKRSIHETDHFYELSDDDRHVKRRVSRYESAPAPAVVKGRHSSGGWREKGIPAATITRLSVY